jgi:hypothetical protein
MNVFHITIIIFSANIIKTKKRLSTKMVNNWAEIVNSRLKRIAGFEKNDKKKQCDFVRKTNK